MDGSNASGSGVSRGLVIVAIPSDREHVWKISSEKIPHLTLCYLGDQVSLESLVRMTNYLSHVVKTTMDPFGLSVKRRGTLGENQADVLFFDEAISMDRLRDVRSYLLANNDIYDAYHSTDQFPDWLPHLTLGFPDTPAKPDIREYPGDSYINFDRIALWTGPYKGVTFELTREGGEMSMSEQVEDFLEHFGTKGMKWGVRKDKGHEGEQAKVSKIQGLDKKFEKNAKSFSTLRKSYNAAALAVDNEDLPRINAKKKYDNVDATADNPLAKAYRKEYHDAFVSAWQRQLDSMGTNASGTKKVKLYELDDGTWEIKADDISHAGIAGRCFLKPRYEDGKIVSSEIVEEDYMEQADSVEDFLEHFGVKGMKWGVVRKNLPLIGEAVERTKDTFKIGGADSKDKVVLRDLRKKATKGGIRTLNDADLQKLVKRAELESKYRKFKKEESEASRAFMKAMWESFGKDILGSLVKEGIKYKFGGGSRSRDPFRTNVVDGRIIERATKLIGK